jgi:hypothetical protein
MPIRRLCVIATFCFGCLGSGEPEPMSCDTGTCQDTIIDWSAPCEERCPGVCSRERCFRELGRVIEPCVFGSTRTALGCQVTHSSDPGSVYPVECTDDNDCTTSPYGRRCTLGLCSSFSECQGGEDVCEDDEVCHTIGSCTLE